MCGFAGEFLLSAGRGASGKRADVEVAAKMARALVHRGPDQAGQYASPDGRFAVAFRRLGVIDLDGSRQPMTAPDGQTCVAFNGEIYNFRELRGELASAGWRFATAGDTEVLLALYARDGADMLDRLDGMFAFAIYDAAAGRLMLARDRLGEKPLWYAILDDRVVFASEAAALLRHPKVGREINKEAVTYYLTMGYIPAPLSAWRGIRKLCPGHMLRLGLGPDQPQPYWRPAPADAQDLPQDPAGQTAAVRDAVARAVESRMIADVPLGALLSGGLDSSIVVSQMVFAAGKAGGVRTFTAGFDDDLYDERPAARATAERLGTDHTEILVHATPAESLDQLVARYGEPFADSSALPTYEICKAAREHVTVALVGDGGDEVFCGYDRYAAMDLASRVRPWGYLGLRMAGAFCGVFGPREPRSWMRRLARFAEILPHPPATQYFMLRRLFAPKDLPRLLTDDFLAGIDPNGPESWFCELYEGDEMPDEAGYGQRHDLMTYLPDDLLVKTDIASMACSLELRTPMLDHRLVSLGLSLPRERKFAGRRGKAVLRDAFGDQLPQEVLDGPKRGFGVPLRRWLRGELFGVLKETLMDPWLHGLGIVRPEAMAGLLNDHFAGKDDHSQRLWALLVLARWLKLRE